MRDDRVPQVAEVRVAGATAVAGVGDGRLEGAEPLVAPDPAAVFALLGVVQDAAPQRRLGTGRVVLDRASEQFVEAVEALGAVDELGDHRRLRLVDARGDVDEHDLAHELGRVIGQRDRRHPAQRHPDDGARVGRQRADRHRDVFGVGPHVDRSRCARRRSDRARGGRAQRGAGRAPSPPCPRCGRSARRRGGTPARVRRRPTRGR